MRTFTFGDRIRYRFDAYMAKGAGALVVGLGILTLALVILAGAFLAITGISPEGEGRMGFLEAAWAGFMRTLDAGTMGGDSGWGFRIVMLAVTIGGVFIVSALISVLSAGLESRLESLRRGRSVLVERGHTVILGYSGQLFPILEQLILANESEKRSCVAILSERDKTEVEEELDERIPERGRTRIIVRSGSPTCVDDLRIINLADAKSIIVLADEAEDPDNLSIKTLLAVRKEQASSGGSASIVAEIEDPAKIDPARIASDGEATLVRVTEIVSRIIAQCCRQSGLSAAYLELLDFEGNEIYFREPAGLPSMSYREALFLYPEETAMGVFRADGSAELNPPMDARFKPGDKIIVLAEDDKPARGKASASGKADPSAIAVSNPGGRKPEPERTLILSWNERVPLIVEELDGYAAPGSAVRVASSSEDAKAALDGLAPRLKNQSLEFFSGDTSSREFLESLDPSGFDRVVLMSPDDEASIEKADARSLITLLHLRDMAKKSGKAIPIVSEIMDIRNRELADAGAADDFIVSDRILSLMIAMLSENPSLEGVFEDLLDSGGSELYLKPATAYVKTGVPVSFATVVEAAARLGETAVGYSIAADRTDAAKAFGILLNPAKSFTRSFEPGDRIVVLSAD